MDSIERYRGALLGLAAGDALGTTVEFASPGTFAPLNEIVGGGPFRLAPGQWTDDTSMALCLAESVVETGVFDPIDQLERYVRWYRYGHLSSVGHCFDIGGTTRDALIRFEKTHEPYCGRTGPMNAGNGSLMRLAPVPLRWAGNPREAIEKSGESSRTTHGAPAAIDACRYFGSLIAGAIANADKAALLSERYSPVPDVWESQPLVPEIDAIACGSFKERKPPEVASTGYVVRTLEAALWAFYRSDNFEEGCRLAVNLGGDADTCGAVYGQIAGAFYGESAIPQRWRDLLAKRQQIEALAESLLRLAGV